MSALEDLRRARSRARLPLPRNLEFVYPLLVVVAALVTWYLWVSYGDVPEYLWPSMSDVIQKLIHSGQLRHASRDTIGLILTGFVLAVGLGITLAGLTVTLRPFEIGVFPIIVSTQFVPLIALAPMFIVWFGFGRTPQLLIVTLFGYFSVFISTLTGLRSIQIEKIYLAKAMHAGPVQTFVKIRLPDALPQVFGGLKLAITSAVIGAVVAEFTVGSKGIGSIILTSAGFGDSVTLVAGVIYLGVIGAVAFGAVVLLERIAVPWRSSQRVKATS
jgi:NitT/TauT family transport system permease protein